MTQAIVDGFKSIQVEKNKGEMMLVITLTLRNSMFDTILKQRTIGQTRKKIVHGLMTQCRLGILSF